MRCAFFLSLVLLGLLFTGCSDDDLAESRESIGSAATIPPVAFAVIDGNPLGIEEVKREVTLIAKLAELVHRPIKETMFAQWANRKAMQMIPGLISAAALEKEAHAVGCKPDLVDRECVLGRYRNMIGHNDWSFEQLESKMGGSSVAFRKRYERECLFEAYFRKYTDSAVTERDVEAYFLNVTNRMKRANAINADALRRGNAAWKQLQDGRPWKEVADEYSEDALLEESNADFWKEWGAYRLSDIGFDVVRDAVALLKVGEFTKPLDTEEGLVIVKLVAKDDGLYRLARILIRMANNVEIPTPDQARKIIRQRKLGEIQTSLMPKLRAKCKIEYPMGTNFVYNIWPEPERKVRKGSSGQKENGK